MAENGGSLAAWLLCARRRLQREEEGRRDVAGRRRSAAEGWKQGSGDRVFLPWVLVKEEEDGRENLKRIRLFFNVSDNNLANPQLPDFWQKAPLTPQANHNAYLTGN